MALDKLLSLPERQQLEGARAGLLLGDSTDNEEEEEQIRVCEIKTGKLMESVQGDKNVEDERPLSPILCFPAR